MGLNINDFEKVFSRPAYIQIDLTNDCNLNCQYCYNKANTLSGKQLSDKEHEIITKKVISELTPLAVTFSGGEPLLKAKLFLHLASLLKKGDIQVHLNTNGLLITRALAKEFKKISLDGININIDSLSKQDQIRGGNNLLAKTLENLQILKEEFDSKRVSISCVVTKLNYKDIMAIAEYVKENNFRELHFLDMVPSSEEAKKILLSKEEWLEFFETYKKIKELGIKLRLNHALLFMREFDDKVKIPFCMAGRFRMVIAATGQIVPCNYFKEEQFVCGNALKDNLLTVWRESEVMKKFRYFNPTDKKCVNCKNVGLCTGGCRAFAKYMCGDPFVGDPYCTIYDLKNAAK